MKYYFKEQDSERCYTKEDLFEMEDDENITEMQVYPAKMIKGELVAWCTIWGDAIETQSGDCGKDCSKYMPRNGKNGRCKFSKNCYEPDDKPVMIKIS